MTLNTSIIWSHSRRSGSHSTEMPQEVQVRRSLISRPPLQVDWGNANGVWAFAAIYARPPAPGALISGRISDRAPLTGWWVRGHEVVNAPHRPVLHLRDLAVVARREFSDHWLPEQHARTVALPDAHFPPTRK